MAVSWNLGQQVPVVDNFLSSHAQKIYLSTSLDENFSEFQIQRHRNYYVDLRQTFVASKLNYIKDRGFETYNRENKNEHKKDVKA